MEAKLSPLKLLDFVILSSSFKFTKIDEGTDISIMTESYTLDIDFAIFIEPDYSRVFVKALVNGGETQGYTIFAEGMAVFALSDKADLDEAQKKNLLHYSSVSIALNSLRGFIMNMTGSCPLGKYILPSIDVAALFAKKNESLNKEKKSVKKSVKKK